MTSRSTANEVKVPSILADFEPGDRIFCPCQGAITHFGGVISVEADFMMAYVYAFGDEPQKIIATGDPIDDYDVLHISRWKKMPDAAELKIGDVLSTTLPYYVSSFGKREFFVVTEVVPGSKVILCEKGNPERQLELSGFGGLDTYLQYWDLEP